MINQKKLPVAPEDLGEDSEFAHAIDLALEPRYKLTETDTEEICGTLTANTCAIWVYLDPILDPVRNRCVYTGVWAAFETFFDRHCANLKEEEDRANVSVKWLHSLKLRVANLEAVDKLLPSHPFSQFRDRFAQISERLDELTEFVMHKFRCHKFGVHPQSCSK